MNTLPIDFAFLHGAPALSAVIRTQAEDFQVFENLGFTPEGEGEHVFLYIRKRGENTDWVARQLANFAQISPRDVSYAGKKDRHAVTEQWFCVKFPIKRNLNWKLFGGDSIQVLEAIRHPRKLRLGTLQGNRFKLKLRTVSDMAALQNRVELVKTTGVPNYFGSQRFGHDFGNLEKGIALLKGEFKERQRNKKGIYISAVRSWLFNQLLSMRIANGLWDTVQQGDALMIDGSQSCFVEEQLSEEQLSEELEQRLNSQQIHLTGPMWGRGEILAQGAAAEWERATVAQWHWVAELLENIGLKQERRALRLCPQNISLEILSPEECWIEFELPAGAFATSVLRELCQLQE